jgi:hypothetical protein
MVECNDVGVTIIVELTIVLVSAKEKKQKWIKVEKTTYQETVQSHW